MDKPLWVWEEKLQRYRSTKTGQFIGIEKMQSLRVEFMETQKSLLTNLMTDYHNKKIDIFKLDNDIKDILKKTYIDMYSMGAGGRNNMTQSDWGKIGAMLKKQYGANGYLKNLLNQIANGEVSYAQVNARLNMYINSANQALWKGYAKDLPDLPAYPGDGSTVCLTNCQCQWEIIEVEGGWDCYWRLGAAEHCPDCMERAGTWNPYRIRIEVG